MPAQELNDKRHDEQQEGDREDRCRDGLRKEDRGVALTDGERAARLGFGERAENQSDHRWSNGNVPAPHDETEQPESIKNHEIDDGLMQAVSAECSEH